MSDVGPCPDPRVSLLDGDSAAAYRDTVTAGAERVARHLATATRPFTGATPDDLAGAVDAVDLDAPVGDADAALDELERLYLDDAVWFHHPRYLAHLNCPVALPALLGETVLAAVNSSLDTWDQSAGGTLLEQRLLAWTAERAGLGPDADGVFTSGGTQSNLHALLLAREEAVARVREAEGAHLRTPEVLPRLRVLASEHSHFSVAKAAALLGLGWDAVVPVACGPDRRMRTVALAEALDACHAEGSVPMAVVATAGTTDFGGIDPLHGVADLCREAGAWMHVDAAYGCGLLVSPRRRHLLDGVERADSLTVDFHKAYFQPVSSSAVLVRDRATLRHATYHADYLNPAAEAETPNQVDKSLQTTRRFDALKLWLTLRVMGADAVGTLFDSVVDLADDVWRVLDADPRFEVVTRPMLSTLVFRYVPRGPVDPAAADAANRHARAAVAADGEAVVGGTTVDGRAHLKLTLLNPKATVEDVTEVLDLLAGHAAEAVDAQRPHRTATADTGTRQPAPAPGVNGAAARPPACAGAARRATPATLSGRPHARAS